jgi:hypothetical protein
MGLRGFARVGAMVLVSELGGAWRFAHPRQLMAYLGLVPTENTSDERRRLARPPTSLESIRQMGWSGEARLVSNGYVHQRRALEGVETHS